MGSASIKWKMKKMADSRELDVEYKWRGCCWSFLRKGRPPSLGNTLRVRRTHVCPLHTRMQENPRTCSESLHVVILECWSSVNWNGPLHEGYLCSFWERNVRKVRKVRFNKEGFRIFLKKLQDLIL
jgi:hypothetical protein